MSDSKLNPFARNSVTKNEGVVELRGRELQVGDEIIINTPGPIFFRVVDISPVLDPNAPPNLLRIEVGAAIHWTAVKGQRNMEFIRVRTAAEAGPMNLVKLPDVPEGDQPA